MLKITLVKSVIGNTPRNRATVKALGLGKTGRSVIQEDTAVIRGMVHHVKHLLRVEVVEDQPKARKRRGTGAAKTTAKPAAKAAVKAETKAETKAEKPEAAKPKEAKPAAKPAAAKPKTTKPAATKPKTTKKTEETK